jgi:hypothetical protein
VRCKRACRWRLVPAIAGTSIRDHALFSDNTVLKIEDPGSDDLAPFVDGEGLVRVGLDLAEDAAATAAEVMARTR